VTTLTPEQAYTEAMKYENRAHPYRFFDEMRKVAPVACLSNGLVVVTGYKELVALTHDPRLSSDARKFPAARIVPALMGEPDESVMQLAAMGQQNPGKSMIVSDPPDHDRMRRQAMQHFGPPHSPDLIASMEPECKRIVNELLDKAQGKTRMDVVDDYAYPLPMTIICQIMGVPLRDEPTLHEWVGEAMQGIFDLGPEMATEEGRLRAKSGRASAAKLRQYFTDLVESAAKTRREGMISKMVNHDGPEGRMSTGEIISNCMLLFVAGHDSTVNLTSHCVLEMLRNPWSLDLLRSQPELIPRAIEEVLRLQSSVFFFPSRSALADIEIAGTTIPKGSPVFLMYGAANRDPERFPDPNKFDLERENRETLGWSSGIHICFGGPLARLEVNTAIEAFLRRVANPRIVVDPPPYRRSQVFRGPLHLLIDFDRIAD
jgi:fatty acid omega-hydroxylase